MRELPLAAQNKLSAIERAAEDAAALVQASLSRARQLSAALSAAEAGEIPGDIVGLTRELETTRAAQSARQARYSTIMGCLNAVRVWAEGQPPHVVLEPAPVAVEPPEGEPLPAVIDRIRATLTATVTELRAVERAPLPVADLKAAMRQQVAALADRGRPSINIERGALEINFRRQQSTIPGTTPDDVAASLAWLDADLLIARLDAEIDALPTPPLALSAADKANRRAALTARIDTLERQEEALIEMALASGQDVVRRANASPAAVLGVRARARAGRAA